MKKIFLRSLAGTFLFFPCILLSCISSEAQVISTVAGVVIPGYIGDGGPAILAKLNHPKNMAKDAAGNVYIADASNSAVRKVNTTGDIFTIAGNGTPGYGGDGGLATAAIVNQPSDVKTDSAGNIYICDANNFRIRKITPAGIITTIAGNGISGYSGDNGPATAAEISESAAIAIDLWGNIFIADEYNNCIRKVNTAGIITTYAGTGLPGYSGEGGPATAANIGFPFGVAVDGYGNVFVSLTYDNRVLRINTSGIISTYAGMGTPAFSGDGGPATAAEFDSQWGISCDWAGNLYVADNSNQRIRKVDLSGIISTVAGTGSAGFSGDGGMATAAKIRDPAGVLVSPDGDVYIADYNNHAVRKIGGGFTNAPSFTGGATQTLPVCKDAAPVSINTLLAAADLDAGQFERWTVVYGPTHGTLAAPFTAISTGSTITPTGLTYTPATGYVGMDSFRVRITDFTASDTTTVYVTVTNCALGIASIAGSKELNVFPNPSNGRFTVLLPAPAFEEMHITITDMVGKKVKEYTAGTNVPMEISLDDHPGIYLLRARTTHGSWTKTVMVKVE